MSRVLNLKNPWDLTDFFLTCLTVWREARGAGAPAQIAVAYTITTRAKRGGWWGASEAAVCAKAWQYSSMTDPKDPQLIKFPFLGGPDAPAWHDIIGICDAVFAGTVPNPMPEATHYYDDSIAPPAWTKSSKMKSLGKIGRLNFFKEV